MTAHKMKKTTKKRKMEDEDTDEPTTTGIVLAEDKKYYPFRARGVRRRYGNFGRNRRRAGVGGADHSLPGEEEKICRSLSEDAKLDTSDAKMKCKAGIFRDAMANARCCYRGTYALLVICTTGNHPLVDALRRERPRCFQDSAEV